MAAIPTDENGEHKMADFNGMPETETARVQSREITALARMTYARHHSQACHVIMDDRSESGRELRDLTNPDAWLTYTGPAVNVRLPDDDEASHTRKPRLERQSASESTLEPRDLDIVLGQLNTHVRDNRASNAITDAREALHRLETQHTNDVVATLGDAIDALATAEAAAIQMNVKTDLRGIQTELLDILDQIGPTR